MERPSTPDNFSQKEPNAADIDSGREVMPSHEGLIDSESIRDDVRTYYKNRQLQGWEYLTAQMSLSPNQAYSIEDMVATLSLRSRRNRHELRSWVEELMISEEALTVIDRRLEEFGLLLDFGSREVYQMTASGRLSLISKTPVYRVTMTRDTTVPTFSEHVRFRDIEGRQLERFDRWVERSEHAAMFLEPVPEQPMASARKSEADDAPLTLEPNIVRMRDIWKEQLEQKAEEALDIMERDNLLALFDAPDGLVDFKAVTRLSGVNTLGTMTARERLADTGLFVRGRQELLKSDTWTLTELVTSFMLNPNQENLFNLIIADSNRRDEALKIINETIQRRLDARIRP